MTKISPILQASNLSKIFQIPIKKPGFLGGISNIFNPEYREFSAVHDLTLSIQPGEKVAFLGPNGAGKSTSIKMFTGILTPTSGSVKIDWLNPIQDRAILSYRIGAVFGQISKLYYHLTPIDTFKLFGKMYDMDNATLRARLDWLIESFDIGAYLHTPVRKLSLWERMRAEVVASLIHSPKILFLDEPTIGLDMIAKSKLRDVINTINTVEGTTILLTSHDIGDIEEVCERVIIIAAGGIVFDGSLTSLRQDHVPTREISLRFATPTKLKKYTDIKVLSVQGLSVTLEIPNIPGVLARVVSYLLNTYEIDDLSIHEPETESIIKGFYSSSHSKKKWGK